MNRRTTSKQSASDLTDEQVLKEFVKRFACDGAVLIYLDEDREYFFSRWINKKGKSWCSDVFSRIRQQTYIDIPADPEEGGYTQKL